MQAQASAALTQISHGEGLEISGLLALPEALQYRVLGLFLSSVPQLGRAHLEAALGLCESESPSAVCDLPGRFLLRRAYDKLVLSEPADATVSPPMAVPIEPGQTVPFGPWLVICRRGTASTPSERDGVVLDASRISGALTLRPRLPGDRISLPGGTKKVSRLMIDEKIPAALRDSLPIVCTGDTIAAVLPVRAAGFCRGKAGQDCWILTLKRMEKET